VLRVPPPSNLDERLWDADLFLSPADFEDVIEIVNVPFDVYPSDLALAFPSATGALGVQEHFVLGGDGDENGLDGDFQ
jgi:hypothetical protein